VVLHGLNKGVILRCRMRSKYFLELRVLRFKSWKFANAGLMCMSGRGVNVECGECIIREVCEK
jgi:hypothetical protein